MYKGGYLVLDFNDTAITVDGAAVSVPGIFDAVENTYRKMTVLSRVKIGGVEYPDFPARFLPSGDDYVANVGVTWTDATTAVALVMTVTDEDTVAVASATITSAST